MAVTTLRERDCWPVPHDLVHVPQALNADVTQWIGHGPWLQSLVSALCGHASPPLLGCVMARVRLLVPAPHDVVHAPYKDQLGS